MTLGEYVEGLPSARGDGEGKAGGLTVEWAVQVRFVLLGFGGRVCLRRCSFFLGKRGWCACLSFFY